MRLSLRKGAHVDPSGAAHQEIRVRFGRDDKFVATLIANYLANLSSRPKRSAVERSAVFWTIRASAPWFSHTLFSPATAWIRKKYDFFSKLFKPLKDRIFPSKRIFPPPL
jgi:hypothetical protein